MGKAEFEELMARVKALQNAGLLPTTPTEAQRVDWAYGQAALENADVTREMTSAVVRPKPGSR